jgi:hypothetical protein
MLCILTSIYNIRPQCGLYVQYWTVVVFEGAMAELMKNPVRVVVLME